MALNIVSNYAANVANRYLTKADASASASLAKLSAGTRVLTAKDDAASLAVGSRLNAEVQAQRQAKVNAGQATSMLQIADGAMSKVNDVLVRMKTLAVQAGSGQLSDTERGMLNTEYQALLAEVDRIAAVTKFNGVTLVNGATTTDVALNGQSNTNNLLQAADGFSSIELGNSVGTSSISVAYDSTTDVLTLTNLTTGESQGVAIGNTAIGLNETQTVNFDQLDVVVKLNSAFSKSTDILPTGSFTLGGSGTGAIDTTTVQITAGVNSSGALAALSGQAMVVNHTSAAATTFSVGNFTGSANMTSTGAKSVAMSDGSGSSFTFSFTVTTAFTNSATTSSMTASGLGALVFGTASTSSQSDFTFKLGTGTTANVDDVTFSVGAVSGSALGINGGDILTKANADTASAAVSVAIDRLNTTRAGVGAAQNRLEFAADNLSTTIENTEAARSALMDLDVAAEMTAFTAKQVLVQSGVAMLAQANQMPQNLLKLFQ